MRSYHSVQAWLLIVNFYFLQTQQLKKSCESCVGTCNQWPACDPPCSASFPGVWILSSLAFPFLPYSFIATVYLYAHTYTHIFLKAFVICM